MGSGHDKLLFFQTVLKEVLLWQQKSCNNKMLMAAVNFDVVSGQGCKKPVWPSDQTNITLSDSNMDHMMSIKEKYWNQFWFICLLKQQFSFKRIPLGEQEFMTYWI